MTDCLFDESWFKSVRVGSNMRLKLTLSKYEYSQARNDEVELIPNSVARDWRAFDSLVNRLVTIL